MYVAGHKYTDKRNRHVGFTILELMIATAVFGMVMLIVAVGVIRFANEYYKGVVTSRTQAVTRAIMSQIAASLEFGTQYTPPSTAANGDSAFCIDNTLYSYHIGQQVTDNGPVAGNFQGYHGLVVSVPNGACSAASPVQLDNQLLPTGARELLGQHMRLNNLDITQNGDLYTVRVRVIYGDYDLLAPAVTAATDWSTDESCAGGAGTQYCAVSDLQTTVQRRLL